MTTRTYSPAQVQAASAIISTLEDYRAVASRLDNVAKTDIVEWVMTLYNSTHTPVGTKVDLLEVSEVEAEEVLRTHKEEARAEYQAQQRVKVPLENQKKIAQLRAKFAKSARDLAADPFRYFEWSKDEFTAAAELRVREEVDRMFFVPPVDEPTRQDWAESARIRSVHTMEDVKAELERQILREAGSFTRDRASEVLLRQGMQQARARIVDEIKWALG